MTWPPSSWFLDNRFRQYYSRLPPEAQDGILRHAAANLATRSPIPVTTGIIRLLEPPQDPNWSFKTDPASVDPTTWQALLTLCRVSREAALSRQVIQLLVEPRAIDDLRLLYGHRPPLSFDDIIKPTLPVFEGATRDVILTKVTYSELRFSPDAFFQYVASILGSNVRRIYMQNDISWDKGTVKITSGRTWRTYGFGSLFGAEGLEWLLNDIIPGLNAATNNAVGDDLLDDDDGRESEGNFDDAEARVLASLVKQDSIARDPLRVVYHGEVLRHTHDGITLVNSALLCEMRDRWKQYPTARSKAIFTELIRLAQQYFPHLKYISVLTPITPEY